MLVSRPQAVPFHTPSSSSPPPAPPVASTSTARPAPPAPPPILINNVLTSVASLPLSGGRVKKFVCTYDGCGKAYTRPVRLQEHVRSHTGERPFACSQCSSTFSRDSHLKAHSRTHSTEQEKNYNCEECDKKFWTGQHLRKHVEVIHRGKTYECGECNETFRKHNQLRTHIAEEHSAPGTLPFTCTFEDCDKSFKHGFQLKAHTKTHDPSRYLCIHSSCSTQPLSERQFPTWSALQKHTKTVHPPTCPHPECSGRTFTSNRGLRGHLESQHSDGTEVVKKEKKKRKKPVETETEAEFTETDGDEVSDWEERMESEREERLEGFVRQVKRRKAVDKKRDEETPWMCDVGKCRKRYQSAAALETHQSLKHSATSISSDPPPSLPTLRPRAPPSNPNPAIPEASLLELFTGHNYANGRKFLCPYPKLLHDDDEEKEVEDEEEDCQWRFARIFDVKRHLKSAHGVDAKDELLENWYAGLKDDEEEDENEIVVE